jgi:hypothetical protein
VHAWPAAPLPGGRQRRSMRPLRASAP